jgi:putative membrane protein
MTYLYLKAIHIIFVVSWMAGLFYIVRLFIYHVEANERPELERITLQKQFEIMQHKLWYIITTPAMVLSVLAGIGMIWLNPALLGMNWMLVKLAFVLGLLIYHFICQNIINKLKRGVFQLDFHPVEILERTGNDLPGCHCLYSDIEKCC